MNDILIKAGIGIGLFVFSVVLGYFFIVRVGFVQRGLLWLFFKLGLMRLSKLEKTLKDPELLCDKLNKGIVRMETSGKVMPYNKIYENGAAQNIRYEVEEGKVVQKKVNNSKSNVIKPNSELAE